MKVNWLNAAFVLPYLASLILVLSGVIVGIVWDDFLSGDSITMLGLLIMMILTIIWIVILSIAFIFEDGE